MVWWHWKTHQDNLNNMKSSDHNQLSVVTYQMYSNKYCTTLHKYRNLCYAPFQITLKDEKMVEMNRHIMTLSGQLADLQARLLAAEAQSATLRVELDGAKDEIRSRVTSEASFASMEAALRAKSAQVSTMEALVKAREGQVDAIKRLMEASNPPRPNIPREDSIPVTQVIED